MHKDLLIIGGGINGVGTAADAAGRGLSVVLCEMGDLASGTSSASSNLIHGGLRYLENKEFSLVRESLRERNLLMQNAAHLVSPQSFVMPITGNMRPYWLLRSGLFLYDMLALGSGLPGSGKIATENLGLQDQYQRALNYYDCTVDDSRLVLHVALQAREHGAEILTRTKLIKAIRKDKEWIVSLQQGSATKEFVVHAIVNASGPYVQQVTNNILHVTPQNKVCLVKGSHIVLPKLFKHDQAFVLQNKDGRVIFIIPYFENFTLIGTTEVLVNSPVNPKITQAEIAYLCESVNNYLQEPIKTGNIIYKYAGVRPLIEDEHSNLSQISRDVVIEVDTDHAPLINLFGGKLTTYRSTAEKICDHLKKLLPHCSNSWTAQAHLPGSNFPDDDKQAFQKHILKIYANLPTDLVWHYLRTYGTRVTILLQNIHNVGNLGQHFGGYLYKREVDFLRHEEWAQTAEDILWRRGKQGLLLNPEQVKQLETYLK